MKKLLLIIIFSSIISPMAHSEIKDFAYDGKEIYVHARKDHVSSVIFPEPIIAVLRGFGADSYVVERDEKKPDTLQLMPTDSETAEMTVTGVSGEDYVLRFVSNDNFYTKLIIHKMAVLVDKNIVPESVVEKQGAKGEPKSLPLVKSIPSKSHNREEALNLPPELNQKITLKGNNLPLRIYLSTISQVTGYNVITTPDIDSQKTSINLEDIEVWRALKSLLYKFGYGFKVSQEDLIITETETRIFSVSMPAVDQSFTDETSNQSFADSNFNNNNTTTGNQQNQDVKVGTKIYYQNSSPKLSLWTDLESNVKSMISPQVGSYSINKVSGSIIVTDKPGVLDKIGDLVSTINENLSRQQSFEIQIIEVRLSNDHEAGIDWNAIARHLKGLNNITAATNFSSTGFLSGQLFTLSATGPDPNSGTESGGVSLMLKALDSMGIVNVVSRPSITVSNIIIKGLPGDHFEVAQGFLKINKHLYHIMEKDSSGRSLRLFYPKEGVLDQGKYILLSDFVPNSWDSRYWGPVGIQFLLKPLWVWEK